MIERPVALGLNRDGPRERVLALHDARERVGGDKGLIGADAVGVVRRGLLTVPGQVDRFPIDDGVAEGGRRA